MSKMISYFIANNTVELRWPVYYRLGVYVCMYANNTVFNGKLNIDLLMAGY